MDNENVIEHHQRCSNYATSTPEQNSEEALKNVLYKGSDSGEYCCEVCRKFEEAI